MTAIAGIVGGLPPQSLRAACAEALAAQSLYGHQEPRLRTADIAAFGIRMFETLPEDRFDRQPLCNERFLQVADIRLDNSADIRRALGEKNSFASIEHSDADLLFAAWLQWGEGCLDRIIGDYAVAVFDRAKNKLFLARDPAGQRPLFYALDSNTVCFASMPSGLFATKTPQLNTRRLAQILANTDPFEQDTSFLGIQRVLPGQVLEFAGTQFCSQRRWEPTIETRKPQDELVELYRSHLDEAVACRMRRVSGPLATHLSSGYDSSAVTATAARLGKGIDEIIAFTSAPALGMGSAAPKGHPTDESAIAADTAHQYGIEHVVARGGGSLLAEIRGHARAYQEPVRNVLNIGWWKEIQRLAVHRGARVLLTAERGNMTLNAGTVVVLSEWLRKGEWRTWWRQASAVAECWDVRWRGLLFASFQPWLPPPLVRVLERINYGADPSWLAPFVRRHLAPRTPWKPSLLSRAAERVLIFGRADPGPLRKGSLAENGIDERDPMADRRLLEFSLTLPPEQLLDGGLLRPLARKALSDRLPPAVIDMPLRGYQGGDWAVRMRKEDAQAILEEISPSSTVQELLNLESLHKIVTNWPAMDAGSMAGFAFARDFTRALAMGVFIREVEQNPKSLGV